MSACCSPFSQAAQIWVGIGSQFYRAPKPSFLCSFLVTAGLQDKRAPFEPRGDPETGKDKHQTGQLGLNPHPLWCRAPPGGLVRACPFCLDSRTGISAPNYLEGFIPQGMWVLRPFDLRGVCLCPFRGRPGVQMAPACLVTRQLQEKNTKQAGFVPLSNSGPVATQI